MPFSRGCPDPGIEPRSPTLQADPLPFEPPGSIQEVFVNVHFSNPQQNGVCWKRRWGVEYWGKNEQIDLGLDLNRDIPIY